MTTPTAGFRRPAPGTQPEYLYPAYGSTVKRAPQQPLVLLPHTLSEMTAPVFGYNDIKVGEADLTRQHQGEPQGERITVSGQVLDEDGKPIADTIVEVWQCNAAGRYAHHADVHDAPLDPNFSGYGRVLSDADGRYSFTTIKPGAYPWRNHPNAWRPAHIHLSLFGQAMATRLVTQMYFPGDPLLAHDPIFNSTLDQRARDKLISSFDWPTTKAEWSLGYRFDIVLRGRDATPMER
jgi:protocatechuate 3,4-dioxygenase beta subunit